MSNTETQDLEIKKKQILEEDLPMLHETTQAITVVDYPGRQFASTHIETLESLRKEIEGYWAPSRKRESAYRVYEDALDTEKKFYAQIDLGVKQITKIIKDFDTAEAIRVDRERQEAERKQRQKEREEKEANDAKIAAEEKRLFDEEVELQRQKDEAAKVKNQAIESGNKKLAEAAAKQETQAEAKLENAQATNAQKIEELKVKAEEPKAETVKFTPPPVATKKLVWKCKVTNLLKLCHSISVGLVPFTAIEVRASSLNEIAKNYDGVSKIEGLQFYQESTGKI